MAFEWTLSQDLSNPEDFYKLTHANHYCVQKGTSKIQKTLHYYASCNFNDIQSLQDTPLGKSLNYHINILLEFYDRLTGNNLTEEYQNSKAHPQIIHYPQGGGYFAKHTHSLYPNLIGVICSISKYGLDYFSGGTGFETPDGQLIDVEEIHDAGDVALFRYDLPHWVGSVDTEMELHVDRPGGRWTLILPHY